MFSIEEIKKMKYPYELFSDDLELAKKQYVELLQFYHPDLNKQKKEYIEVIEKINKLYEIAEERLKNGAWIKPGLIRVKTKHSEEYSMKFRISHSFELGNMYIGDDSIMYLFDEKNESLAYNALDIINNLKYNNNDMEKEFKKYIPKIISSFKTVNNKMAIIIEKDEDLISLKDILAYYEGKLSASSTAWILTTLYNLYCFIHYNNLTHNGITIENYFISPKNHRGALLGGWWYARKEGEKLPAVPSELYEIMDNDMKKNRKSNMSLDLDSIRLLGRTLLGDKTGISMFLDRNIPLSLKLWLRESSSCNPFNEYTKWSENIVNKFEERKIVTTNLNKDDLYKKIGGV